MGICMSSAGQIDNTAPYIPSNDDGEQEFKALYVEGQVLGQGEFGAVKSCAMQRRMQIKSLPPRFFKRVSPLKTILAVLESKDKNHSQNKFKVISISKLRTVLEDMHHRECVDMIGNLPNARTYDSFAYHVAFLKQFSRGHPVNGLSTKGRQPTRMSISGGTVMTTELHVSKKDSFSNFPRSKQTVATSVVVGGSGDQIRVDLDALKAFQLSAITNGPVETKKESRNGFAGLERLIEEGLEEEDDTFPTFETLEEGEHVC